MKFFRALIDTIWLSAAVVLVALALYVSLGRQLLPLVSYWQDDLQQLLSTQLKTGVTIDQLEGSWQGLGPKLKLKGLEIKHKDDDSLSVLGLAELNLAIDISASLYNFNLVFSDISFNGIGVHLEQNEQGQWWVKGLPKSDKKADPNTLDKLLDVLLLQKHIAISNVQTGLTFNTGVYHQFNNLNVVLDRLGDQRRLQAAVTYSEVGEAPLKITLESRGDPRDLETFSATGYASVAAADWSHWLPTSDAVNFSVAKVGASAWMDFQQGRMTDLRAQLDIPVLGIERKDKKDILLENLTTDVFWSQENSQHRFWFNNLSLTLNQLQWPERRLGLFYTPEEEQHKLRLLTDSLDLPFVANALGELQLLTASQFEPIAALNPRGYLENIDIDLHLSKAGFDHPTLFDFKANAVAISVDHWGGVPQVSGLNGFVQQRNRQGLAEVSAEDVGLFFPTLYQEGWQFRAVEGWVDWDVQPEQILVSSGPLKIAHEFANAQAEFALNLVKDESEEDLLALSIGINELNTDHKAIFLPEVLGENLLDWLDKSILTADLTQGQVLYQGAINSGAAKGNTKVQVALDIQDAAIKYLPEWPVAEQINAAVMVNDGNVDVEVTQARLLDTKIDKAYVKVATNQQDKLILGVTGEATTDMATGLRWFKETPIRDAVAGSLDQWQGQGAVKARLNIQVPLDDQDKEIVVEIQSTVDDVQLDLQDVNLQVNQVNGKIDFSLKDGLFAEKITAQLFDQDVAGNIITRDGNHTIIGVSGAVDVKDVREWMKQPLLSVAEGITPYQAFLHILPTTADKPSHLDIHTELEGVKLNLPTPYAKEAKEKESLTLSLTLDEQRLLNIVYSDKINAALDLGDNGVERGQLYLGTVDAYLPSEPGLVISGHISQVNWDEWLKVVEMLAQNSPPSTIEETSESLDQIRQIRMRVDNLIMFSQALGEVDLQASRKNSGWAMQLNGPNIAGKVWVPDDLEKTFNIDLKKVYFPAGEETEEGGDALAEVDPAIIPAMKLKIGEMKFGAENFGRWQLETEPQLRGVQVKNINGRFRSMDIAGDLGWEFDQEKHYSWFKSTKLAAKNLKGVLKAWKMDPSVESKKAKFTSDISWQGSPLAFNFETLNGSGSVDIRDGRFIADAQTGALKVFGMLNFNSITRRLKLDFSDLYESGLSYDEVKGSFVVNDGLMHIQKPMVIDGPGGKFQTVGKINLVNKQLDQELVVTLPVTGTLPLVAVLAGLNPVVAGAIWVTDKLIGDKLERFTSLTYEITGSWDDPKMKLKKTFDNTLEQSK